MLKKKKSEFYIKYTYFCLKHFLNTFAFFSSNLKLKTLNSWYKLLWKDCFIRLSLPLWIFYRRIKQLLFLEKNSQRRNCRRETSPLNFSLPPRANPRPASIKGTPLICPGFLSAGWLTARLLVVRGGRLLFFPCLLPRWLACCVTTRRQRGEHLSREAQRCGTVQRSSAGHTARIRQPAGGTPHQQTPMAAWDISTHPPFPLPFFSSLGLLTSNFFCPNQQKFVASLN